ncbi:Cullin family-domain-containing protein [Phascolomyces articulosus]|uniref:Cullin family-domain-containing protein n=1 Tax=Phascolomyces articulosus TaxID=60185 RepID=A0AAD5KI28_9FUNG|nr:Cullin family-domain-containing protein [Phascolomyces articulosus]
MPPKNAKVAKKRKTSSSSSSNTQTTLDSFRRIGASPHKVSRDSNIQDNTKNHSAAVPMNIDHDASTLSTTQNATLGTFRRPSQLNKVLIRNFKELPAREIPNDYFEEMWENQRRLLLMIFHKEPIQMSLQLAYEACETICRYHKAEEVYRRLESELLVQIQVLATSLSEGLKTNKNEFISALNREWSELCSSLVLIRNIFMELDRRYLIRATEYSSIIDLGKQLFREHVMGFKTLQDQAIKDILALMKDDRDGKKIDKELIRSLITMLLELNMYTDDFEPAFLKSTRDYYQTEADRLLHELTIPDYLLHASQRYKEEGEERIQSYLEQTSKTRLLEAVKAQFVYVKIEQILEKGFDAMMDNVEKEPLHILYTSIVNDRGITHLRAAFSNYIKRRGTDLIRDPKQDARMITSLLGYKAKLDEIVRDCFNNDEMFLNALKESFEAFVNSRRAKPAELLAKFIDSKLRASSKQKNTDEDLEQLLDRLLIIFRYLQGKDAFEAFYKRFLSKRLLLSRSASNDLEKSVLAKLKTECGAGFTKNLEAMFKDIEVSGDLNSEFKSSAKYPHDLDMVFQVNVLAQGIWPTYSMCEFTLPPQMSQCQSAFEGFYPTKFTGRRLTWQNSLASCAVKAYFPLGTKDLTVSLLQTTVLLLFNDTDILSYMAIAQATNMEEKELKRTLQSLACGQHKLLLKDSDGSDVQMSDTFKYNSDFTATSIRLKINVLQQEQSGEERKATETKVLVDRQHQLEAAIVRVMKAKQKLNHTELMDALFSQVRFPLEATDIKKRIESLIDREYLGRDEENPSTYIYK